MEAPRHLGLNLTAEELNWTATWKWVIAQQSNWYSGVLLVTAPQGPQVPALTTYATLDMLQLHTNAALTAYATLDMLQLHTNAALTAYATLDMLQLHTNAAYTARAVRILLGTEWRC